MAGHETPGISAEKAFAAGRAAILPHDFSGPREGDTDAYLADPAVRKLVEFFEAKGLAALKDEDRDERWYEDWIEYQARHRLYANLLVPAMHSTQGSHFDLLRLTRFLEVFAYFSPAHGYSLQVTFLGLFAILMGSNEALKREAAAALEAGGVLAFGVSEKGHGSDLLSNEFTLREAGPDQFIAEGSKYYIGNSNRAAIIAVLARKQEFGPGGRERRAAPVLLAIRPALSKAFRSVRKIRTLGVRAAFVGEFEVVGHELPAGDLIAEGRAAWDALFGTVALGRFFLGFGSIGICEHALAEANTHLGQRRLYGKTALDMPHIRAAMATAYARLAAMKLYAFRALDYVQAAGESDRRYLLFTAVQKAKVSSEGVKVMALISECVGAKGFEADTYTEMALRDIQLIPGLEGSTHINLTQAAQFIPRYFAGDAVGLAPPVSLAGSPDAAENPYLMRARSGGVNTIAFPHFLDAYRALAFIPSVRCFARQTKAFELFMQVPEGRPSGGDTRLEIGLGQCLAGIAYGQLIAENCTLLGVPAPLISAIFQALVHDLSVTALTLASSSGLPPRAGKSLRRMVVVCRAGREWDEVSDQMAARPAPAG